MAELNVKVESASATVRPGHTLVVACPAGITDQIQARIKQRLEAELPGVRIVVVGCVSQMLAYEPAPSSE